MMVGIRGSWSETRLPVSLGAAKFVGTWPLCCVVLLVEDELATLGWSAGIVDLMIAAISRQKRASLGPVGRSRA
jgi:hypothetical protein